MSQHKEYMLACFRQKRCPLQDEDHAKKYLTMSWSEVAVSDW